MTVSVSHPLEFVASQLPQPAAHEDTRQVPVAHVATALGSTQGLLHAPQLAFVLRFVSHPSAYVLLQSSNPALHDAFVHVELTQAAVPFAIEHALPHEPQFRRLVVRSVSHPLPALPSQSPNPAWQSVTPQTPLAQYGVPPVALHLCPQVLQLLTSTFVLISQPLLSSPSQFAYPGSQVMPHVEPEQDGRPFWLLQTCPQALQLAGSVLVLASQPLAGFPSQSA